MPTSRGLHPMRSAVSDDRCRRASEVALVGLLILAVGILVVAVHWRALSARAVSLDDQQYLIDNPLVRHPSWGSVRRFLCEVRQPSTVKGYYQPLTMISLMLDCALGGGPDDLRPLHRTSLVLHAANACLLIMLLYALFGRVWPAAMVGLLFGVHPLTVEPITWIGERKTLLASLFALGTLIGYVRYARRGGTGVYGGCLAMFLLALMAKPTVTPMPVLLLILDYWPLRRLSRRTLLEKVPFLLLAGVSAAMTTISQGQTIEMTLPAGHTAGQTLLLVCHNLVFYPYQMIRPVRLASIYPFPEPVSLANPTVLAGVIGTAAVLVGVGLSLRWTRAGLAGWLFFAAALAPTMMNLGYSWGVAADKYAYLPAVGLLLPVAVLLARFWPAVPAVCPWSRRGIGMLMVTALLAWAEARGTRRQLDYWQDSVSLYRHMLDVAPRSSVVHNNLANALRKEGDLAVAIDHYRRSIKLKPLWPEPHYNLGLALAAMGDDAAAVESFTTALVLEPDNAEAHNDLATSLYRLDKVQPAMEHYTRTLELRPEHAAAHNNLGNVLLAQQRVDEAIDHYRQALRARNDYAEAHMNLATALVKRGDSTEALHHYRQAVRLSPGCVQARRLLADVLLARGHVDEAIGEYREALRVKPRSAVLLNNLANALVRGGQPAEAVDVLREAIRLDPEYYEAHLNLGLTLLEPGRAEEATACLREAVRLRPESAKAHYWLGRSLEALGQQDESAQAYRRAVELEPQHAEAASSLEAVTTQMAREHRDSAPAER